MYKPLQVELKNDKLEENTVGITPEFPYTSLYVELDNYAGRSAPWHWHKELEFFYMEKGSIEYHTPNGVFLCPEGSGGFLNANVLHMTKAVRQSSDSVQIVQIFDRYFLSGQYQSIFDSKYVNGVVSCQELEFFLFDPANEQHAAIIKLLKKAFVISEEEEYGYEFHLRNVLSDMWLIFTQAAGSIVNNSTKRSDRNSERIKAMIEYIQSSYTGKVELHDIAKAALISERECFRCFKTTLGMTPFEFLTNYRLQMACELLTKTAESITNIGTSCGFSSNSYFGKIFKKNMNCTPKEYRQNQGRKTRETDENV